MTLDQEFTTKKEVRARGNFMRVLALKGILAMVEVFAHFECKTVGNLNPEGLHCFVCTFNDIAGRIERAIAFWEKDDMYKEASS
jgi:hypothetical protein